MKHLYLSIIYALGILVLCLTSCEKSDHGKTKSEKEATKNGMQGNPGDYTPAPLNTSMTPRATPKATEANK